MYSFAELTNARETTDIRQRSVLTTEGSEHQTEQPPDTLGLSCDSVEELATLNREIGIVLDNYYPGNAKNVLKKCFPIFQNLSI